jgi:2-amino-4-hydroxy-6-hydroxymethyldihydropteridine diphosphokinase
MDNMQISLSSLTMPHPRISERLFVLLPLADVCPERILPTAKYSIRELREMAELRMKSSQTIKLLSTF